MQRGCLGRLCSTTTTCGPFDGFVPLAGEGGDLVCFLLYNLRANVALSVEDNQLRLQLGDAGAGSLQPHVPSLVLCVCQSRLPQLGDEGADVTQTKHPRLAVLGGTHAVIKARHQMLNRLLLAHRLRVGRGGARGATRLVHVPVWVVGTGRSAHHGSSVELDERCSPLRLRTSAMSERTKFSNAVGCRSIHAQKCGSFSHSCSHWSLMMGFFAERSVAHRFMLSHVCVALLPMHPRHGPSLIGIPFLVERF